MREIRPSGLEGGGTEINRSSLPLSLRQPRARRQQLLAEVRDDADPSSDD